MYLSPYGGPLLRPDPLGELIASSIKGMGLAKEVKEWEKRLDSGIGKAWKGREITEHFPRLRLGDGYVPMDVTSIASVCIGLCNTDISQVSLDESSV